MSCFGYDVISEAGHVFFQSLEDHAMLSLGNQEGASLVTVLMATAMAGFLALGLSRMHEKSLRATKNIELKDDLLGLRRTVRNTLDCSATLTVGNLAKALPSVGCTALQNASDLDEVHYVGTAFCPPGYSATGGGGECQVPPHGGSYHGSQITADGRGWSVDCCTYVGSSTPSALSNAVFVTCRKDGT